MSDYSSVNSGSSSFAGDGSSGLFEPDVVLPGHFFASRDKGLDGGERKLMAALLSDGVEAFITQSIGYTAGQTRKTDAIEWVETIDSTYVFSFDMVCESLGLNPNYLRLGLSRYVASVNRRLKSGEAPEMVWKKIRRPRKR